MIYNQNMAWARQVFFTLTEHGAIRVLDALTTLALIRVMVADDFGLFTVYQSWVGILLLFLPSLEMVLYREYHKLKKEGRLLRELEVYRIFNYFKLALAFAIALALTLVPQPADWGSRVALIVLAFALPLSQALYGFLREPLRFELKQEFVALIGAAQRLAVLGAVIVASRLFPGNVLALSALALLVYFTFGGVWAAAFRKLMRQMGERPEVSLGDAKSRLGVVLGGTVLWIHINGVITQSIQTLDTFALSLYRVDLAEIGRYGVALKAANFFQIIPVALVNSFGVYLGRSESGKEGRLVWVFSLVFVALSALLLLGGMAVEEPLIRFLGKGKMDSEAVTRTIEYFRWLLAGVLLQCASHPLSTYLGARSLLRQMFTHIFLPWFAFTAATYVWAASQGALRAAQANVVVYGAFWALLIAHYVWRHGKSTETDS